MKSKQIVESDNIPNSINNIVVNKQVLSDIFSKDFKSQFSRSPNQSNSESIHIFKNEQLPDKKSNHNLTTLKINSYNSKLVCTDNHKFKGQTKAQNSTLHPSVLDLKITQRISKIEEKLAQLNYKLPNNMILDSRIKSLNDASELEESKIVKNKSFLSNNF